MTHDTEVLIVGAGPVGLTLAIALGRRGVRCTLIEKKDAPEFLPKMERCNARTMEIFRRMGLADEIRAAGLPGDVPMDVYVALAMNEPPLLHLPYPSVAEAQAEIAACNDGSMPLEPYQLISQYTLEPLLKAEAERLPTVTVLYGCEFLSLSQTAADATACVRDRDSVPRNIRAQYIVGCDGGSSAVRKQVGIQLLGEGQPSAAASGLVLQRRSIRHDSDRRRAWAEAGITTSPTRNRRSSSCRIPRGTGRCTPSSIGRRRCAAQFERTVGVPVRYEMLYVGEWKQNLLLADRYRSGRVFLAGDSAHLVIPTGGLGMNTGVGDAIDLAWKLHATLRGWGGPHLLDSYEIERRQVGDRNVGASRYASLGRRKWRAQYRPNIREASADGQTTRDSLARVANVEQRKTNEMIGAELGYRYVGSPVIWDEPGGPEHLFREYVPTTWPGARLPHVWVKNQTPVQDLIGDGYTLLRLGHSNADTSGLERAMRALGVPFEIVTVSDDIARDVYGRDLILLRPDLHIAWRGNDAPADPGHLAALVTGRPRPGAMRQTTGGHA